LGVQPHWLGTPPPPQVLKPVQGLQFVSVPPQLSGKLPHLPAYCGELHVNFVQHVFPTQV